MNQFVLFAAEMVTSNPAIVGGAVITGIASVSVAAMQLLARSTADKRHQENTNTLATISDDVHEIRTKLSDHGERIARLEERTRTYPPGPNPFSPTTGGH